MDYKVKKENSSEFDSRKHKDKKHKHRSRSRSRSPSGRSSKKHKKHKKHSRSRSQSQERRMKQPEREVTVDEMEMLKAQRQREKEVQKALETPEEKRARRLEKKETKAKKNKEKMGWDAEYMEYTNADNPFGDEHLHETFVWNKKQQDKDGKKLSHAELEKMQKKKIVENRIELEKVRKRRKERENEREERERDHEMEQRDKESEYYSAWERQEDNFHLQQAKLRSEIRIEDGRAKPIDLLAKYISTEDTDLTVEMHEPYTYLNGLTIADLEDLIEDIRVYGEWEQGKNADYWNDLTIIAEDERTHLRKIDPNSTDVVGERRSGVNAAVEDDVVTVFKGKTLSQLALLQTQIKKKLDSGQGIDVSYWESLSQQLKAHMARTRLRDKHQDQLRRKLFKLKEEQGISESKPIFPIAPGAASLSLSATASPVPLVKSEPDVDMKPEPLAIESASSEPSTESKPSTSEDIEPSTSENNEIATEVSKTEVPGDEEKDDDEDEETLITEEDLEDPNQEDPDSALHEEYNTGGYSPRLIKVADLDADTIMYDPEDDMRRLEYARQRVLRIGKAKEETDKEFEKIAREGMNDDEAQFSVQMPLEKQALLWSDKYRPRKPRFFNRVHTGFEWNKYNQTHYDIDNPPPKIVQGYKFNIFYPDLIEKTKTPEYFLTPLEDNTFAILRFHTGPPYEDIAFKVVNREWEYSYKRGFRCQFHNNIFQLWFHFKRYRYRR